MSYHQNANCSRNRQIYQLWMSIQDIIGPTYLWPVNIRRLFWIGNLNHFQRIVVSTFVYVNGLNPEIFMQWVELLNLARNPEAIRHFNAIFRLFESGRNYRLYAYNVSNNRYEYLDGSIRIYTHKSRRQYGMY